MLHIGSSIVHRQLNRAHGPLVAASCRKYQVCEAICSEPLRLRFGALRAIVPGRDAALDGRACCGMEPSMGNLLEHGHEVGRLEVNLHLHSMAAKITNADSLSKQVEFTLQ